ncbi:MAG: phenylalanine--tRNA ligase subunit beta [Acidimicrobiia bacterium]
MRAPYSWLSDFTPLTATPTEVADVLNRLGFEVEALHEPGRGIQGVIVARILDVVPHPDADRLRLADVDFGGQTTRVVCGAPNIVPGMVVPFAPSGASLPGGFTLERRKIRGVISDGMLCSARELGISEDHEGILPLVETAELGTDVRDVLGLNDAVFEIAVTPNRPDVMSIMGIARELAAFYGLPFTVPELPLAQPGGATASRITVNVEDSDGCPRYRAHVAQVVMGPSPEWMARRLTLAGMRPISNVVDVTNYVLLECNQPLHAFDLAKLGGSGITVRRARDGETMVTLDDVERALHASDLLICDAANVPQAIAGIMGGSTAEVSATTAEILLEAAYFDPATVVRTSKRLGLRSESSARFERGMDPNGVAYGAARALQLLQEVAGATVLDGAADVYPKPIAPAQISIRTTRTNAILGTALGIETIRTTLTPLVGAPVEATDAALTFSVPTRRPDLEREIDLIEEVARHVGIDSIARTLPNTTGHNGGLSLQQKARRRIADACVGLGCSEAYTTTFLGPDDIVGAGGDATTAIAVANPLRAEASCLRPSLRPGLLRSVALNQSVGIADIALFELGTVFLPPIAGDLLPDEHDHLAVVLAGSVTRTPVESNRAVDVYDATDVVRAVADVLRISDLRIVAASVPGLHPTRAAEVWINGVRAGVVGEIDGTVCAAFECTDPVVYAELDTAVLYGADPRDETYTPVSRFPANRIDLAFVLDDTVSAADVVTTLTSAAAGLAESVVIFDEFRAEQLGPNKRSVAYALTLRAPDRTLDDAEMAEVRAACIAAVHAEHGAVLRA